MDWIVVVGLTDVQGMEMKIDFEILIRLCLIYGQN